MNDATNLRGGVIEDVELKDNNGRKIERIRVRTRDGVFFIRSGFGSQDHMIFHELD